MKKAFTLVEVLITVSILGILAAIVLPQFRSHAQAARESAAKDTLRILRNAIEHYAATHEDIAPGYPANDPSSSPGTRFFWMQMIRDRDYLSDEPVNPFSGQVTLKIITNAETFPVEAVETDTYGWIYKPATKEVRLNWSGTDSGGISYFDY